MRSRGGFVAYELVFEAVNLAKFTGFPTAGFFAGAATFFLSDRFIGQMTAAKQASTGRGLLVIVLDGIPEPIAIGVGILAGGTASIAMLVAVWVVVLERA